MHTYDKQKLIGFLKDLDEALAEEEPDKTIDITVLGGSAMSMLGIRDETHDIDFFYKGLSYDRFSKIVEKLYPKYHERDIDYWEDGVMELASKGRRTTQRVPEDYIAQSREEPIQFKHIRLRTLHPIDIILTKIDRQSERDMDDIRNLVEKFHIGKDDLAMRFEKFATSYEGNEELLRKHFSAVMKEIYA